MTEIPNTKTCLTQQALHIYDTHGEQPMLDFVAAHMAAFPAPNPSPHALVVLQDHTAIQSADFLYTFLWLDQETYQGRPATVDRLRSRPAAIPRAHRLPAPPAPFHSD